MLRTRKKILLFILIFSVKLCYIIFINNHFKHRLSGKYLATSSGDTPTYIEPVENLISHGNYGMFMSEYTPFVNKLDPKYFPTIRTPHYGIIYMVFRFFSTEKTAFDGIVLLQLLIEVLSIIAFSGMIYRITRSQFGYFLSLFFLTMSFWITFYSGEIITESLTCSFILLGFVFFQRWLENRKKNHLIISGSFFGYAIILKPFLLPVLLIIALSVLISVRKLKTTIIYFSFFCIPFILFLSPWVIRNYITTGDLILFSKPMYYPCKKLVTSCGNFLNVWGGDPIWWEGKCKSAGTYFFQRDINKNCEYKFPDYVFTPDYNMDDFREMRSLILTFQENTRNDSLDIYIASKFDEMTASFIKHNPFHYYVIAPIMRIKNAFIKSGSYFIDPVNFPLKIFKIFQTLLYWFPLFFGTIGLICFGLTRLNEPLTFTLTGLPIILVAVLIVILKLNEWRYFIHIYPIFVFFMIQLFLYITRKLPQKYSLLK